MESSRRLMIRFEPRGEAVVIVRLSVLREPTLVETKTREQAATAAIEWVRETARPDDVVDVFCGSRYVGSSSAPTVIVRLILSALKSL